LFTPQVAKRISIWNRTECRKISGNAAPMDKNLHVWPSPAAQPATHRRAHALAGIKAAWVSSHHPGMKKLRLYISMYSEILHAQR
jgi:hypothetical protein